MTLLRPLFQQTGAAAGFGTNDGPTLLTPRHDVVTSDAAWAGLLGMLTLSDYAASYQEIVRKQLWVRIAVNKLAYTIGRLPLETYVDRGPNRKDASGSLLGQLIEEPNTTKETGFPEGLVARLTADLMTYSNSLTIKEQVRPDREVTGLMPVSPRGWSINADGNYEWRSPNTGKVKTYEPWQIIHIIEPGPTESGFGTSRLEAARLTLAIEYAAQRLGAATFQNGARPGGIVNVRNLPTGDAQRKAAVERFKAEVMERFGGPSKSGLPAVLEGDTTWIPMAHNLDDSAVVAHRQLTRMEVAALYDIPQPAIGILDEANFASIDQLHVMLYQDTLGWPIKLIEGALKAQLIRGVPAYEGHFLEFNLNAAMRGAFTERTTGYQRAISSYMTPNEIRALENLAPLDDDEANHLHIPAGSTPDPAVAAGKQNAPGTNTRAMSLNGASHE